MAATSPEERLRIALEMADLGVEMTRARLRRENPDLDETGLLRAIEEWLHDRPGAPFGDCPGRLSTRTIETGPA